MADKADDQKTGGSGKEAGNEGADGTPAGQVEGQEGQGETGKQTPETKDDKSSGDKSTAKPKEKKFDEDDVNRIVQERLDREKKRKAGEFEALYNEAETKLAEANRRLSELEADQKESREAAKATLQAEIDALPEELKSLAPDMSVKGGIKKAQEWLTGAKKIAEKLSGASKVLGNSADPKAAGQAGDNKTQDEITKLASEHSIYRSF